MILASCLFLCSLLFAAPRMLPCVSAPLPYTVLFLLSAGTLLLQLLCPFSFLLYAGVVFLLSLYLLFYAEDLTDYRFFLLLEAALFFLFFLLLLFFDEAERLLLFAICYPQALYGGMAYKKKQMEGKQLFLYGLLVCGCLWLAYDGARLPAACFSLVFLLYARVQYDGLHSVFARDSADFQKQVMEAHYREVTSVYLNMRGWRHDYHNHIQTLKAYLALKRYEEIGGYLSQLEQELAKVDLLVKSGNVMMDAIMNAKLSLAQEQGIAVTCKVSLPEKLPISDTDLCVIVGNLMDNALEACAQLKEEKRFLRVYAKMMRKQFYFSIMNSAQEELTYEQRHYISEKRGNHGHGMKRVKLCVERYDGYLNLKNEPGVFVSEVMIPFPLI